MDNDIITKIFFFSLLYILNPNPVYQHYLFPLPPACAAIHKSCSRKVILAGTIICKAMADKASSEKAGEKNFFARTAKNTTKRAKRAQEKV